MTDLTLLDVRPWGGAPVDIAVEAGRIVAVTPHRGGGDAPDTPADAPGGAAGPGETVDGRGLLALPGLVNAHAHLDKSWWGRPWVPYGGEATTQGRIAHERAERDRHGVPGVEATVLIMRELLRHGTTAVRSHVDVDLGVGLRGLEVVREAAARLGGALEVEVVAFPQDGVLRRPGVLDLLDRATQAGATSIGGLDPAGIDRDPVGQLDALFDVAVHRDVDLDIHLHDGNDLGAFQYDLIVDRTLAAGRQGRVTVSHGFALGDVQGARQAELVARLGEAGVSWTSVAPPRQSPLPWALMREHGVTLGLGTDGIRDLWSPYGDGDLLRVALMFARQQGVVRDEDLVSVVELATTGSAPFVHRAQHDLLPGSRADVVLLDAENVPDALVRAPRRELVLAGGRVVVEGGELVLG